MENFPYVPPEIRDSIIDEVGSEALNQSNLGCGPLFRQTLMSFHAASIVTRRRALRYIYHKIQIFNDDRGQERIKELRNLIEYSPLAQGVERYIKDVVLSFAPLSDLPRRGRPPRHTRLSPEDFMRSEDLIFVIRRLTGGDFGVEKLTLRNCHIDPDHGHLRSLHWANFPLSFQSAFVALVRSPLLLSLDIDGVFQFPVAALEGSRLKNLVIYQVEHSPEGETNVSPHNNYPSLKNLSTNYQALIHNSPMIYQSLFQNLTELVVESRWDDPRVTLRQVLVQCGQTLSRLTLNIQGPLEFDFESLCIVPNLKAFAITSLDHRKTSTSLGSKVMKIQNLALLLLTVQPMEYLEEITLDLKLCDDRGFGPHMDIKHFDWKLIDESLSSGMYPNLQRVDVSVTANMVYAFFEEFDRGSFVTESAAYLTEQFRRLKDSDISFSSKVRCEGEVVVGHREEYDD